MVSMVTDMISSSTGRKLNTEKSLEIMNIYKVHRVNVYKVESHNGMSRCGMKETTQREVSRGHHTHTCIHMYSHKHSDGTDSSF